MGNVHSPRGKQLAIIVLLGLASASLLAVSPQNAPSRFVASEHPAAVLAWAKLRCDPAIALRHGAPLAQTEDVFQVAAAYDQALSHRSLAEVCADALDSAADLLDELPRTAGAPHSGQLASR